MDIFLLILSTESRYSDIVFHSSSNYLTAVDLYWLASIYSNKRILSWDIPSKDILQVSTPEYELCNFMLCSVLDIKCVNRVFFNFEGLSPNHWIPKWEESLECVYVLLICKYDIPFCFLFFILLMLNSICSNGILILFIYFSTAEYCYESSYLTIWRNVESRFACCITYALIKLAEKDKSVWLWMLKFGLI